MTVSLQRLRTVADRFEGKTVLVLGDLIADEYVYGKPARISREAPVLILRFQSRDVRLGGAANACHNILGLGARVIPVGVLGTDAAGDEVLALFRSLGVTSEGIVRTRGRPTPVKTRIMAGGYQSTRQQVVRVDREPQEPLDGRVEDGLASRLAAWGPGADAILVSDYGYRTVSDGLWAQAQAIGRRRGAVVSVDSRYDLLRFRGLTAATPNEPEVEQLTGAVLDDDPSVEKAGRQLLQQLDCRYLLITRGSRGMVLLERDGPVTFLPIHGSDEIADVTGAGDTVISTFTLALASGSSPLDAAWLANVAGGVVVMKRGTTPIVKADLLRALGNDGAPREP
ncbi:MAG: bifunctional hydroxymethylpyrimidine kinase/phosphomethylpyrimidine kinase [Candidatus Rokubacteria bacterium]|nr:bifunctional hydroxymethylpyrimidine kinase/phosphomethylpyrimidine kinase [Candidatus Rokubacteria bacterium]